MSFAIVVDGQEIPFELDEAPVEFLEFEHTPEVIPKAPNSFSIRCRLSTKSKRIIEEIFIKTELLKEFGIDPDSPDARKFVWGI